MDNFIKVKGARQHNLKNIDLDIPKNKLVVFTGVSGSGKSSFAMDTLYAEGQRRYVESLSSYARQFLGVMEKPDVDSIEGLSPSIAIDQKSTSHNPRSTVGTITEIYDYLRLLFARIGHPHCPKCGREISKLSAEEIADRIIEMSVDKSKGIRLMILATVIKDKKGEYSKLFENLKKQGYTRIRIDGVYHKLSESITLIKTNRHTIEVIVDRVSLVRPVTQTQRTRLVASVESALKLGNGSLIVLIIKDKSFEIPEKPSDTDEHLYSQKFACPECNLSLSEIEPRSFSFNSPHGACPNCAGLGNLLKIDEKRVINNNLSVSEGGILPWGNLVSRDSWFMRLLQSVAEKKGFSLNSPIGELTDDVKKILLFGTGIEFYKVSGSNRFGQQRSFDEEFEGVIPNLERRYKETDSDFIRKEIEKYMNKEVCPICNGSRLKKEALGVSLYGKNIAEVSSMSVMDLKKWLTENLERSVTEREKIITNPIGKELQTRLQFLLDVGLDYLTISREATTLAGGEAQRIRLASQIGSGLSGILYVLDEPSIGLHQKDQGKLVDTLKKLRDLGNTVVVVEHDPQTILSADYIFDFGPGAGDSGGNIIARGAPQEILNNPKSLTGLYLSGKKKIDSEIKEVQDMVKSTASISILGCSENNLRNVNLTIPLKKFVCVTGVSGSGKSTLVNDTFYRALKDKLGLKEQEKIGAYREIVGVENIDKVIFIDQSPIGKTPRSNPATYTKAFDYIRQLFAQTPEAKLKGYKEGRFSFNVAGGRCEACEGEGQTKIEMQFLPDVFVPCEVCQGKRYNHETLEVLYKGKNIDEILNLTIEEAVQFFSPVPSIAEKLVTIMEVGLGYLKLGQSAPTLSGGESQRVKLSRELSKRATGKTIYILDEPTTGLHFEDLKKLLFVLKRLVAKGNTVLVIEHNLEIIKRADHIIDLGPDGGKGGGKIIFEGTPETLLKEKESHTARALRES